MANNALIERSDNGCKGAALLEFALIGGLFLFVLLAVLDICRYGLVKAILTLGAQRGLALAEKIDGLGADLPTLDPAAANYAALVSGYTAARTAVANEAAALPLALVARVGAVDPNAPVRLRSFTPRNELPTGIVDGAFAPVLLLRPGDTSKNYLGQNVHHVSRCSSSFADCAAQRTSLDTMDTMLRDYPIFVRLEAEMRLFSPFFARSVVVTGIAAGWREKPASTDFAASTFSPETLPVPLPTPVPVGGGGGGPGGCAVIPCPPGSSWDAGSCACGSIDGS